VSDFPQILAYVPADAAARQHFQAIGLPVPENSWRLAADH
jgi:hypothetical protein